jgi:hypothetical protein
MRSLNGFLAGVFLSVCVFALSFPVHGPMIQPDEGSYLGNAAAIAGFPNDLGGSYHSGYSMLIAPAFRLARTPQDIWTAVKAINAVLYLVIVLSLLWTARILKPEADQVERMIMAGVISLYPMWVIMAGYAFAQMAFVPVFLLLFISYCYSLRGGIAPWLATGILAGFLYWVHPTGGAVIIALFIAESFVLQNRRCYGLFFLFLVSAAGMVLFYTYGITPWVRDRMTISGLEPHLHYSNFSSMLSPLLSLNGIKEILARTAGHFFYLTIGSVGLIWVGLFSLTVPALQGSVSPINRDLFVDRAIGLFLWLSFLGVIGLSVLNFSSGGNTVRLDHWMYGRYVEGVIAPILLAGALSESYRKALSAIPIALICAVLLSTEMHTYAHTARFNVSAFWQDFFLREEGLWFWLAAGCVPILLAGILPRRLEILLIAIVFLYSGYLQIKWHDEASRNASVRWEAALKVRDQFPPGTCVAFDHSGMDSYEKNVFWFDFGFILFDYKLQRMSAIDWLRSCDGLLFTYDKALDKQLPGIYPVPVSLHEGPALWVRQGFLQK